MAKTPFGKNAPETPQNEAQDPILADQQPDHVEPQVAVDDPENSNVDAQDILGMTDDDLERVTKPEAAPEDETLEESDPEAGPRRRKVQILPDGTFPDEDVKETENTEGRHVPLSAGLGGTYKIDDEGKRVRVYE